MLTQDQDELYDESQNLLAPGDAEAGGSGIGGRDTTEDTDEEKMRKMIRVELKRVLDPAIEDMKNQIKKQFTGIDKKVSTVLLKNDIQEKILKEMMSTQKKVIKILKPKLENKL